MAATESALHEIFVLVAGLPRYAHDARQSSELNYLLIASC